MPKKGTRHVREPGNTRSVHHHQQRQQLPGETSTVLPEAVTAAVVTDEHLHSDVHIGATNSKRWLLLKKRLGLSTDEDVAVYLLDLADTVSIATVIR